MNEDRMNCCFSKRAAAVPALISVWFFEERASLDHGERWPENILLLLFLPGGKWSCTKTMLSPEASFTFFFSRQAWNISCHGNTLKVFKAAVVSGLWSWHLNFWSFTVMQSGMPKLQCSDNDSAKIYFGCIKINNFASTLGHLKLFKIFQRISIHNPDMNLNKVSDKDLRCI